MKPRGVVFDLDGTLIDGYAGVHEALAYALERMGKPVPTPEETRAMVGHGLDRLVAKAAGEDRAAEGVRLFRERYPEVAVAGSHLLPGARETLETLAGRGIRLAVASNKPPDFSRRILDAFELTERFALIAGPGPEHPPKPDPAMLRAALAAMETVPETTVCVGDMEVDVEFARAGGCRVVVLPTGSRSRKFLEGTGADGLIGSLWQLPGILERLD
jgi:phosphoglycolate phosphatase